MPRLMDVLTAGRSGGPVISAHRGCSAVAPENTIAALDAAWQLGAAIAEIDVQLTRDGHVVLLHDRTVDRTTDGTGLLKDHTLAQIERLDAGSWFSEAFAGERVPALTDVLEWSRGRLTLLVELKNYYVPEMPLLEKTVDAIEASGAQEYVVCSGFDHVMLSRLRVMRPDWPIEIICGERLVDPAHAARAAGADLVSLEPQFCLEPDIKNLHEAGIAVLTTVLQPAHAVQLRRWGLDVFQSDDVAMIASALGVAPRPR